MGDLLCSLPYAQYQVDGKLVYNNVVTQEVSILID